MEGDERRKQVPGVLLVPTRKTDEDEWEMTLNTDR
jgi:hypothetical protein